MAERTESIVLDFEVDVQDSIDSIESLTKANKELRAERNKLNLDSKEGQKRLNEINATLDKNTDRIKDNVSALEKQKINIGNYRSALEGVVPELGAVTQGVEAGTKGFAAMAKSALAFIATPIGAILAALVAVFTLLKTAISTNNELFDKFENITNAIGVVVEVVTNRIGKLGEALVALASGNFREAINLTGEAFGGLGDEIVNAVAEGQRFLDLSRDLEDAQRDLTVATAQQENRIKALVVAAKNRNLTFDEQEEKLKEALRLEEALVKERERLALLDLEITAGRIASTENIQQAANESLEDFANRLRRMSTLTDDQVDPIIEKLVALEQARGGSLAFQEKVENNLAAIAEKRAVAQEKLNAALAEQEALERANRRAQNEFGDTSTEDPLIGAFETRAKVITDINQRMNDDLAQQDQAAEIEAARRRRAGAELAVELEREKFVATANLLAQTSTIFEQESIAGKAISSAQALINTYLAATAALASGSKINPVFGIISAAAAVAAGLASVARINGVEFAEGGWTGQGNKWDVAGVVHRDEYVVPKRLVHDPVASQHVQALERMRLRPYADGGLVASSISTPINQQLELLNIVKNLPPQVLDVREVTNKQKRISVKEAYSKR